MSRFGREKPPRLRGFFVWFGLVFVAVHEVCGEWAVPSAASVAADAPILSVLCARCCGGFAAEGFAGVWVYQMAEVSILGVGKQELVWSLGFWRKHSVPLSLLVALA